MPKEPQYIPIRKKRKKRNFGYLYLFAFVFLTALAALSYIVKIYSPDIDVTIGNNEALTLSESDMEVEIKSVDERLKWIQTEDEMPTVAIRESSKDIIDDKENIGINEDILKNLPKKNAEKKIKTAPVPSVEEIKTQKPDFRIASSSIRSQVIPKPKPLFTKVYLGNYKTIEDAISVQNKVSQDYVSLNPFIKAVNDYYIVQMGSFTDEEKAEELVSKLKQNGYNPKITYEK